MRRDMTREKQYGGLDHFRMAAAFLVAAIHTSPLASFSAEADFVLTRVLARVAVPFFFMVTGYFLLPQYLFLHSMDVRPLKRFYKKHIALYGAAILLYLPVNLYAGQLKEVSGMAAFLRMILVDGTFYHLWYLPAAILGVALVKSFGKKLSFSVVIFVSFVLYLAGLFGDSYYGMTEQIPVLRPAYDLLFSVFSYTRNGVFYAPVFLVTGAGISRMGRKDGRGMHGMPGRKEAAASKRKRGFIVSADMVCLGICLGLMTAEGLLLHRLNMQRHDSMYVMLPAVMFFLFRFLISLRIAPVKWFRMVSMWIYLVHPLCIILVRGVAEAVHLEYLFVENSLLHYLAVCAVSMGCACAAAAVSARITAALGAGRESEGRTVAAGGEGRESEGRSKASEGRTVAVGYSSKASEGKTVVAGGGEKASKGRTAAVGGGGKTLEDRGKMPERSFICRRKSRSFAKGRAWIELDRGHLLENVRVLESLLAPGQQLMPAVKANAYGHGAALIAGELQRAGIGAFCVACAAEGAELRKSGITGEILVLGYTHPKDFFLLRKYDLIQTVVDHVYAKLLDSYGRKIRVHVKIDTGMHRLGERAERKKEIGRIFRLKNLRAEGIYTHLCADETREPAEFAFTRRQAAAFYEVVEGLSDKQRPPVIKTHLLASCGLLNYPELGGDYVRCGIALYGLFGDREGAERCKGKAALLPVMSLKARVAAVKEWYQGESVGYGLEYEAERDRKIAVLAIGYADGLPRSLSGGRGRVLLHGQSAPVVGRICMDQTIVDITGIKGVRAGDSATVIGRDGGEEITAYEIAQAAGTITNEIVSRMGERLPRIWRE